MRTSLYRLFLRTTLVTYGAVVGILSLLPRWTKKNSKPKRIIATGSFYSDQWLVTHLLPIASSKYCEDVTMVAATPVPPMKNVTARYPPKWLNRIVGNVGSRLCFFCWLVIKERPDTILGFHLLVNGLLVALLGRLLNINTIYICGGGPREVLGGGYSTESRIFNKIQRPDKFLEARLIQATKNFDLIVTMGKGAAEFFKSKGIKNQIEIIPGGFDDSVYTPIGENQTKEYDLIMVGRLSEVKRIDRFLEAIQICAKKGICYRVAIVGGGPDKTELVTYAETLEINTHVTFVGWSDDVSSWLQRSRVFVLTSDSEGLSQALIQAMMCGLPAVVSDVGDLGDLVNRHNGHLVNPPTAQNFAYCFQQILDTSYEKFASNALESSKLYRTSEVILQWDRILRIRL